ncbi:FG-GAP-like repeat-containing protein [Geobacter sp. FeAm09]|uniref:FG-GAP-like repeat-containing protein n=1 Tax=Geobacter sp. FeAm09 TaxID=2597769 RepID=UPI00143D83DC|nr:FG-GAP-like repeat-containing protein [Geobacter sp. FeAm09]
MARAAGIRMAVFFMVCCVTAFLAGCSGGGGGSAKSGQLVDPASSYTGTAAMAVVTGTNAEDLALSGFGGTRIAAVVGSVAKTTGGSTAQAAARPPAFTFAQALKQSVRRMDIPQKTALLRTSTPATATAKKSVARAVSYQIAGDNGGTASYALDVNDTDGTLSGTIDYQGFTANGIVIDGTTDILGTLDASRQRFTRLTLSFRSLVFRSASYAYTLTGTLSWGFNLSAATETLSMNMVLLNQANDGTYWFNNYEVATVYGTSSLTQTMTGRYYDHEQGYVDLTTRTPLVAVYGSQWPSQGSLAFSGTNNRWARLDFQATTLQVLADTDGDGATDWQVERTSNVTPPVNTAPVANAGPDQTVSQYATVHLDGSASSDADGDPLTYTWTLVSGPAYPALTGAATAAPSFVATTQGTYVLRLTVYDGNSTSQADTVTVTVTPPTASNPAFITQQWQYGIYGTYIGQAGLYTTDLDGDGTPEVIASSFAGAGSAWYVVRKNASGGYDQVWRSPLYGVTIVRILLADMNGDGKDDVVVALADGTVSIYDGPTLKELRTLHIMTSLSDIAVADLDGDGIREIVASDGLKVSVYDSQTGAAKWSVASGGGTSIAVGNVDAAAAPEIVTTTYGGKGYVLDGQTGAVKWSYANSFGSKVRLADLDGDGMQEIVGASSWYKITIFDADLQTPTWEIATSLDIGAVTVADADGDCIPEIVYGDGQWGKVHAVDARTHAERWAVANPEHGVSGIALGDVDLDGKKELLWCAGGTSSGPDYLYIADPLTGTVKWQNQDVYGLSALAAGDVDDDGSDEIVMVTASSNSGYESGVIHVFNAATHALKYRKSLEPQDWMGYSRAVSIGDVDGDGHTELVVSTSYLYGGLVSVYSGATGALKHQSAQYKGNFFPAVAIGDVDNDGKTEIVAGMGIATSEATGKYLIVFDGATMQEKWRSVDLGGGFAYSIKIADLDKDGHPDIILTMADNRLIVYDGVTHVQKQLIATAARAVEVADVDGDGYLEVLVGRNDGYIDVYDGVTFAIKKSVPTYGTTSVDALRIADLKGDGSLSWLMASNGVLSILDAQGGLKWRSSSLGYNLGKNNNMSVKDVNGNGSKDIFIGSDTVLYQFE